MRSDGVKVGRSVPLMSDASAFSCLTASPFPPPPTLSITGQLGRRALYHFSTTLRTVS